MIYELFGVAPLGGVCYLGTFGSEDICLKAMDQYEGLGYKNLKCCNWMYR